LNLADLGYQVVSVLN